MGFYINPQNETKESFLQREGALLSNEALYLKFDKSSRTRVVILWYNEVFTAAQILHDELEHSRGVHYLANDIRDREIYLVSIDKILEIHPEFKDIFVD